MRPPRIALYGFFGQGNLGNDATLVAMAYHLRQRLADVELACICPGTSRVADLYDLPAISVDPTPAWGFWRVKPGFLQRALADAAHLASEPWRRRSAERLLQEVDHVIVAGTGALDDFGTTAWDQPLNLYRWCVAATKAGVPLSFVSVGAGPNTSPWSRLLFRAAAQRARYCSYRDAYSKRYMERQLASARNAPVYPDLAFSLPHELLVDVRPAAWPPQTVGVGVINYRGWNCSRSRGREILSRHLAKTKEFVAWLLRAGYRVRLLIGDGNGDPPLARDVAESLGAEEGRSLRERIVCEPVHSLADLLSQINATDVVVASRFHNVVLALLLGRPTISLEYHAKNKEAMSLVGLQDYCQRLEMFDVEQLKRQFRDLADCREVAEGVSAAVEACRQRLNRQYDCLAEQVAGCCLAGR